MCTYASRMHKWLGSRARFALVFVCALSSVSRALERKLYAIDKMRVSVEKLARRDFLKLRQKERPVCKRFSVRNATLSRNYVNCVIVSAETTLMGATIIEHCVH